ncbi:MAG: dTDP-4-dehydrorhamnose 3,5-epimerase [Magnetococcus sp. YQC-9]
MGDVTVDAILVTPLTRVAVAGGDVMHGLKRTDSGYVDFGEAYFSWIDADAIKAWKRHLRMTLNLVVPLGQVRFAFIDPFGNRRIESIGADPYARLTVPPGIWFGFQGLVQPRSLLLNVADLVHDPFEIERAPLDAFELNWDRFL